MGNDVNNYLLMHLLKENTTNSYLFQEQNKGRDDKGFDHGGYERGGFQGGQRGRYERERGRGYGGEEGKQPTCFNYGDIGHLSWFYTKPCALCGYFHSVDHVMEDCPELFEKWEEKNENYNMVIVNSCREHKLKEEVDIQVVIQRSIYKGTDLQKGECLGQ
jgi:hypothetical protein